LRDGAVSETKRGRAATAAEWTREVAAVAGAQHVLLMEVGRPRICAASELSLKALCTKSDLMKAS